MGLTGSKSKSSNPTITSPIAQGDTAIADSINQMIVPADPESREEFVKLMEALGDEEMRAKLAQIHTDQPSGLTELAIALDDPQFIDYVADFNDHYGRVESRSDNARTQLFQVGREMADYLESNYPMAVEMLVAYAERFRPTTSPCPKFKRLVKQSFSIATPATSSVAPLPLDKMTVSDSVSKIRQIHPSLRSLSVLPVAHLKILQSPL